MTLGEKIVKEILSRDLTKDPLKYEEMQTLKKIDNLEDLKLQLEKWRFIRYENLNEISDFADIIINPKCRKKSILSHIMIAFGWLAYLYFFLIPAFLNYGLFHLHTIAMLVIPFLYYAKQASITASRIKNKENLYGIKE